MTSPPLACTVRGCARPLARGERAWSCPAGHVYDIARRGYVNLLQPQDRRSVAPGDSREAVSARAGLLASGIGQRLVDEIASRVAALFPDGSPVVADLGSGSGDTLGAVAARLPIVGIGIDISAAAAEHAARRFPALTWAVANADRRLPLLDSSVNAIVSVHGRRNPAECLRVLTTGGRLLAAVPGPADLIELRAFMQGEGREIDRGEKLLNDHRPFFALVDQWRTRERHVLDRAALMEVLRATYRGARVKDARRREGLAAMEVTFSSSLFVLAPLTHDQRGG